MFTRLNFPQNNLDAKELSSEHAWLVTTCRGLSCPSTRHAMPSPAMPCLTEHHLNPRPPSSSPNVKYGTNKWLGYSVSETAHKDIPNKEQPLFNEYSSPKFKDCLPCLNVFIYMFMHVVSIWKTSSIWRKPAASTSSRVKHIVGYRKKVTQDTRGLSTEEETALARSKLVLPIVLYRSKQYITIIKLCMASGFPYVYTVYKFYRRFFTFKV